MKFLGTFTDKEAIKRVGRKPKKLTHISLFTGIGGIDLGFAYTGIETRVMVEWSKDCCATLRWNWHWEMLKQRKNQKGNPIWKTKKDMKKDIRSYHDREPVIIEKDIKEVTSEEVLKAAGLEIGECSILSAGPPCQGFSMAGKRMIDDPRNSLFKEMVRIIKGTLPRVICFENVPGLQSMNKGRIMKEICEEFSNCGYQIGWQILNAADYGVPQNRKRIWLIGFRIDAMIFLENENPDVEFTKYQIAEDTGYSENSGGFNNSIYKLSSLELIKREGGIIKLNPELVDILEMGV